MVDIPHGIKAAFGRLRAQYPFYISLNRLNGKYYVYRQSSRYNPETKDYKTISEYLGRITEEGIFLKKGFGSAVTLEQAKEIIQLNGGQVLMPGKTPEIAPPKQEANDIDEDDKKILTALSMNGRMEIPYMKKIMSIQSNNIRYRIERLEKKFGIKYFAVIEPDKLGYEEHIAFVKFRDKLPDINVIKKSLENNSYVQFASLTTGKYDMILYFLTEKEYTPKREVIRSLKHEIFQNYNSEWYTSPFYRNYGYIQIKSLFFDNILKERVWFRSKEESRPQKNQITNREYAVLKELSFDGKRELSKIDKDYGFDPGRSNYTYNQLKQKKTIYRISISMQKIPIKYVAIIQANIINSKDFVNKGRQKLLENMLEIDYGLTNKYVLQGDFDTPHGIIFFAPITQDKQLEDIRKKLENIDGIELNIIISSHIISGSLCYRRYDNLHNPIFDVLKNEYGKKFEEQRIKYEQSEKIIKAKYDFRSVEIKS